MRKILFVFGTRPEAIKLCPVIDYLRRHCRDFLVRVCVTAQHRELLDQVLPIFGVRPDYDLGVMRPDQSLFESTSRILAALEPVLARERPDLVIVQGDTTTTLCGALAAFYRRVPVGHVEAGLRTHDLFQPFPEEMNRVVTSRLAALHFAATARAAQNLRAEGVPRRRIAITGNPGIDAVLHVRRRLETGELPGAELPALDGRKKLILVTAHRRESFGGGFERICRALKQLARRSDVQIVYPVHPNPNVRRPVHRHLAGRRNILLTEPLSYVPFVDLMRRAHILLTDSGGIQEEGPSLGKPILVMREKTERPEAVKVGTVRLVGTDENRIVRETVRLLEDPKLYRRMSRVHNPYGDGRASERIARAIRSFFERSSS
ncbi:MAG: UDP-N-acetylglucosamine 2-epimerase (non-hydrolyzing) [Bryobacterales bacterium]|nr:UDP-N-acetylglucosamine 2-epimerase (non-hydrolyzing) [Bryobacteraceae bacterium]MDW8353337.1 UDP-N-acetylglucosamine 2-epimerase (non-hydrolyzing) [Bryobacterales bacterium]